MTKIAVVCFLLVYLIWGSTYLAIRCAVHSLPPWGMMSFRFFLASSLMMLIARIRREGPIDGREKRTAGLSGALLITSNAILGMVERWVPSGVCAVVIGAMPIWFMLLNWITFARARPTIPRVLGALVGVTGVALIAF